MVNVSFGSSSIVHRDITRMAASECIAVIGCAQKSARCDVNARAK